MMKKLKFNRKSYLVIIYTFIVLCSISLITNSTTNSFFKKAEDNVLAYASNLSKVYNGSFKPTFLNGSNEKKALLSLTFNRDTRYGDTEQYSIKGFRTNDKNENSICTIKEVSNNLVLNNDTFTFKDNKEGTVTIECTVIPNERVDYTVKIYEKVTEEEDKFLYKMGSNGMEYLDYYSKFVEIPSDIIINKDDEDIYSKFINLVVNHAMKSDYFRSYECPTGTDEEVRTCLKTRIENYFTPHTSGKTSMYDLTTDNAEAKLMANTFEMLGVTRVDVKDGNDVITGYGFLFDDDFLGYLKTNNNYKSTENPDRIYFSNASNLQIALKNSIKTWIYQEERYAYGDTNLLINKLVLDYISLNANEYTFDILKEINGLESRQDLDNYPYILVVPNIIDHAYNYLNMDKKVMRTSFYDEPTAMSSIIRSGIANLYYNDKINNLEIVQFLRKSLLSSNNTDLYNSVICQSDCTDYTEIYYSNGNYYKVDVIHNETLKYNEIKITETTNLTGLYPNDSLYQEIDKYLTITDGQILNSAIACSENCTEYTEILYNTDNTNNLSINVVPDNTYHVNKINISTTNTDVSNAIISLYNIPSIKASLNNEYYLKDNLNGSDYYEIHCDGTDYLLFEVSDLTELTFYKKIVISNIKDEKTINDLETKINSGMDIIIQFHVEEIDAFKKNILNYLSNIFIDSKDELNNIVGYQEILDPSNSFGALYYYTDSFTLIGKTI